MCAVDRKPLLEKLRGEATEEDIPASGSTVHTHKGTCACTQRNSRDCRCMLLLIPSSHFVCCGWIWSNLQEKVNGKAGCRTVRTMCLPHCV